MNKLIRWFFSFSKVVVVSKTELSLLNIRHNRNWDTSLYHKIVFAFNDKRAIPK